ncbi:hypothetical protein C6A85_01925, partial [Mycobacterium sp. ITM-2017-0098]
RVRGSADRRVGVPDRVRLRRPAVPPGLPAHADRRRGGDQHGLEDLAELRDAEVELDLVHRRADQHSRER